MSPDTAAQTPNNNGVVGNAGEVVGVREESPSTPSLSPEQQAQLAALLSFKPSSRDVISGIAPHVFDDQRPSYRSRRRRRTSSSERRRRSVSPVPHRSPLCLVISVDDQGAIVQPKREESVLRQCYTESQGEESVVLQLYTTPPHGSPPIIMPLPVSSPSAAEKNAKSKRPKFRIDRVFKTLVFRLK
ncbi:hypothetical protein B0H19DRAFT_1232094 [Mycena capillaripes]|nr:hypothetical protein B0H19DRAFT_1232094 [Mycena capillaripes]